VTALAEAYELEASLNRLFREEAMFEGKLLQEEAWLVEDIERTFPVRLYRQARKVGAEPVLEPLFSGLRKALADHPELGELMAKFDRAFEDALERGANREVALASLAKQRRQWKRVQKALLDKDRAATEDLVAWIERDVEERMAIAQKRSGRAAEVPRSQATEKALKDAEKKALTDAEKKAIKNAQEKLAEREEQIRKAYAAFVDAMADSNPENFPAFAKLAAYLKHDDPVWGRIAEKVAAFRAGKETGNLENAIQGIIGEALALRNAWVVDRIAAAAERAQAIAQKLGNEWEVVFTQLPVLATTKTKGMGELYDASIWLVKKGVPAKGEPLLDAAPVFVLQVKSGSVKEAAEQIRKDFSRELGAAKGAGTGAAKGAGRVRLPRAAAAGETATQDYTVRNLQELLKPNVKPPKGTVGSLSTQRILVSPRPPSTGSLLKHMPAGTAIEHIESQLSKSELNPCVKAIAKRLAKR
jgi:hypothetical protein